MRGNTVVDCSIGISILNEVSLSYHLSFPLSSSLYFSSCFLSIIMPKYSAVCAKLLLRNERYVLSGVDGGMQPITRYTAG